MLPLLRLFTNSKQILFFFFGRRKPFRIKFGILTGEKQPAPGTDPAALQDAFNPNLQPKGAVLGSPTVHVEAFEFKPLLPCHNKTVWYLDVDLSWSVLMEPFG